MIRNKPRPTPTRSLVASLACLSLVGATGCGGPTVAPVSGRVTLDGAPLAEAQITTSPIPGPDQLRAGKGSFGKTDSDGRYELELIDPAKAGALIAEHRVYIRASQAVYQEGREDAPGFSGTRLPKQAGDGSLRLVVPPEGTDSADFDLVSD